MRDSVLDIDPSANGIMTSVSRRAKPMGARRQAAARSRDQDGRARRERMVLRLASRSRPLPGQRPREREAILTVTPGWVLFRSDSSMTQSRVMDGTGTRTDWNERSAWIPSEAARRGRNARWLSRAQTICDKDRMYLEPRQRRLLPADPRRRQSQQRLVLSNRSTRPRSVRCADGAGARQPSTSIGRC